ncbi:MAG: NusG domain II-containing protein [Lachnospiraceae bacterium]|nr:NusG domain II-containing protein [Lachnospiraceae bacterium]
MRSSLADLKCPLYKTGGIVNTKKINKFEIGIWIAIISITVLLVCAYYFTSKSGEYVQVKIDGKVTSKYSLKENGTYPIIGSGENILVIDEGEAYIKEANCPDKLCVKQGRIKRVGQSLICLPNKVVVEVVEANQDSESGVDAIVK